jgi:hypothetical protein
MSTSSNQDAMKKYERARDLLFKENKQAFDAVNNNNISKMEKIFKTGGIKQEAIDLLIFGVKKLEMLKLFLRYGGDMHKPGPPIHPTPIILLLDCTADLRKHASDSIERRDLVKLIEFLIQEGADVNAVDCFGFTPFMNCAIGGEKELCKLLVERGAVLSAIRNDGGTGLHAAAEKGYMVVCRYLVEDCGLDIDAELQDDGLRQKTPLFFAALNGNIEVCRYLLEKGAKVDAGRQPLIAAAQVYRFISHSARMATLMSFSFSWTMEPILFCKIKTDVVHFPFVAKMITLIFASCSTNTVQETYCCVCLTGRYDPIINNL